MHARNGAEWADLRMVLDAFATAQGHAERVAARFPLHNQHPGSGRTTHRPAVHPAPRLQCGCLCNPLHRNGLQPIAEFVARAVPRARERLHRAGSPLCGVDQHSERGVHCMVDAGPEIGCGWMAECGTADGIQ